MPIPNLTKNHWLFIISLIAVIITITLFMFITSSSSSTTPQSNIVTQTSTQITKNTTSLIPTTTSTLALVIPYKVIPRNTTYIPSHKPLIEPTIDPNHTYSITINQPFNERDIGIYQDTIFEVNGLTDLPVGTELMVVISNGRTTSTQSPSSIMCAGDTVGDGTCINGIGTTGSIYVEPRCTGNNSYVSTLNTWRFIIDSQLFRPGDYMISVESIDYHLDQIDKNPYVHTVIHVMERPQ